VRWKYSGAMSQAVIDQKLLPALEQIETTQADAGNALHGTP